MATIFSSQHQVFSYLVAGLVTLTTFPLMAWHYAETLKVQGLAAIAGLVIANLVLWYASHRSVTCQTKSLVWVSLVVKGVMALVMLLNAGAAVEELKAEHRLAEIQKRATVAAMLAETSDGRLAKLQIAQQLRWANSRSSLFPHWYLSIGIYIIPAIFALFGFLALTISATIVRESGGSPVRTR